VFVHDHYFPAPGSIFRPLGFASFWLSQALFGTDYFRNAFGDLVLHAAVSLALYRVIRAGAIDRVPAVLCTLLFAVHPAVLGTALWWSARFDLLAMLFGLVAVRAALDYVAHRRTGSLLAALAAVIAALLSKETALSAAVAIGIVWLRGARVDRSLRRALVALVATVAVFFAWRAAVLGTLTTALAGDASILAALGRGVLTWFAHLAGYLIFWPRWDIAIATVLFGYVCFELAHLWIERRRGPSARPALAGVVISGICFFLLPAIVQAPVAAMNAMPLASDLSAVEAAMQSRLYYISIGGLAILLAAGLGRIRASGRIGRTLCLVGPAVCIAAFAWASHVAALRFARTTAASRPVAESIAAAVEHAASPAGERCRIVVLGVAPPPEWGIYVSADSIAKALATDVERVGRCFVESDYPTFFNLMHGDANPADASPYTPRSADGRPVPWLRVGGMASAYLDPPPNADPATLAGIVFLRYENGVFTDVTGDVASGRIAVALR
jgi:hypothetical protein